MSDATPALAIGIVAIITAVGTTAVLIFRHIKKSSCCGANIETRSQEVVPPTTPQLLSETVV